MGELRQEDAGRRAGRDGAGADGDSVPIWFSQAVTNTPGSLWPERPVITF